MKNCPYCGKLTDPKLDNCVHCGAFLRKGASQPQGGRSAPSQNCPSCGALVREGDIICVACGTNLLTGQKIAQEKQVVASRNRTPVFIALGVLAIVAIVGLVVVFSLVARDPVTQATKLVDQGRLTEATSILSEVVAKDDANARAHMELGKIHWTTRSYPEAAEAFRRAHKAEKDREDAGIMTIVSLAQGGGDNALDAQIEALQRLVEAQPDNADYWYLLALARGARGDTEGEVVALEHVLSIRPGDVDASIARGVAKALEGELDTAEADLARLTTAEGGDGNVNAAYGLVASLRDDPDAAVDYLSKAEQQPNAVTAEVLTQLGITLMAQGMFPEAEPRLARAMELPDATPAATYYHAVCLKELGEGRRAAREFETLINAGDSYSTLAAVKAADFYLKDGDAETASSLMEKASRRLTGIDEAERQTTLGRISVALESYAEARDQFRAAKQADSGYAPAYLENGLLFINEQNMEEGIREIRRYLELAEPSGETAEIENFVDQLERSMQRQAPPESGEAA